MEIFEPLSRTRTRARRRYICIWKARKLAAFCMALNLTVISDVSILLLRKLLSRCLPLSRNVDRFSMNKSFLSIRALFEVRRQVAISHCIVLCATEDSLTPRRYITPIRAKHLISRYVTARHSPAAWPGPRNRIPRDLFRRLASYPARDISHSISLLRGSFNASSSPFLFFSSLLAITSR